MKIKKAHVDAISAHARRGYPFEVCGVLLGRIDAAGGVRVESVVEVVNRETETPRVFYRIAPEDLLRIQSDASKRGLDIVGYYHSHPDHPARPSEKDRAIAAEGLSDGVVHMVFGVEKGERAIPSCWIFRDATRSFEDEPLDVE